MVAVINPLIIAGAAGGGQPIESGQPAVRTMAHPVYLNRLRNTYSVIGPALYLLQPGNYALSNGDIGDAALAQFGMDEGMLSWFAVSGYVQIDEWTVLNFSCAYDAKQDAHNAYGISYLMDYPNDLVFPLVKGNQNKMALLLAPMMGLYYDGFFVTENQIRNTDWRTYGTMNLHRVYWQTV